MAESSSVTLGYWAIRGLAAIPRLLLAYTGTPWTDKLYKTPEEWGADKEALGLAFPNIPYLIDGDFKLTESRAIALYIIRRSGHNELLGKDPKETARQGMISGVIEDGLTPLTKLCFNPNIEKDKGAAYEAAKPRLTSISAFLKKNGGEWVAGFLSIADFVFTEYWRYLTGMFGDQPAKDFPEFQAHFERFNALPKIKEYLASDKHLAKPFMPPGRATWTGL